MPRKQKELKMESNESEVDLQLIQKTLSDDQKIADKKSVSIEHVEKSDSDSKAVKKFKSGNVKKSESGSKAVKKSRSDNNVVVRKSESDNISVIKRKRKIKKMVSRVEEQPPDVVKHKMRFKTKSVVTDTLVEEGIMVPVVKTDDAVQNRAEKGRMNTDTLNDGQVVKKSKRNPRKMKQNETDQKAVDTESTACKKKSNKMLKKVDDTDQSKQLLTVDDGTDWSEDRITSGRKRKSPRNDQKRMKDMSKKDKHESEHKEISLDKIENKKGKPGRKRKGAENLVKELNVKQDSDTISKFVGAHVSISGGLYKSVYEAKAINARAFAVFLRSTQRWECKPLTDDAAEKFKETLLTEGFSPNMVLPHGSYLMNCGSPDTETLQKSRDVLIDDLQRCERLGLTLFNFHPGSTCGKISVDESLDRIAESINIAHSKTKYVIPVIENMSCQGNTIGGKFTELRGIIDRVTDKSRIGICLDTCHAFAAGYDLSTEEGFHKMLTEFGDVVGFEYLKAMHLNDSKGLLGCHKDRHENIGKGYIGKEGFRRIMNCSKFDGIPMILETPCPAEDTYLKEIKLLNSYSITT